jgi:hypothetical protein
MAAGPLLRETPQGPSLPAMGPLDPCTCSEDGYGDTGAGTHSQGTLEGD